MNTSILTTTRSTALAASLAVAIGLTAVPVHAADQLLKNPGFEDPVWHEDEGATTPHDWFTFDSENNMEIRIAREAVRNGEQSLRFSSSGESQAFQGAGQVLLVQPHSEYKFVVYVYVDPGDPLTGSIHGQLSIEWLNDRDEEITRTWGPEWTQELAPGQWHKFSLTAPVPEEAVSGAFVITHFDPGGPDGGGTFYVDDGYVSRLP